jgi:hypothetical protein
MALMEGKVSGPKAAAMVRADYVISGELGQWATLYIGAAINVALAMPVSLFKK